MSTLKIRNWERWQSYRRDRGQPPWIKIHREVMRNVDWVALTDAQRGQLVAMWLLAADHDGVIPASPTILQKLCFMDTEPDLKLFMEHGFIEPDANMTPSRRQHDAPETETETETEGEGAQKPRPSRSPNGSRLPDDWTLPDEWLAWALAEEHLTADEARREAAKFADYWRGRAGAGARKLDWRATWQNWCRRVADDRGKVRQLRPEEPDRPRQRFPGTGGAP